MKLDSPFQCCFSDIHTSFFFFFNVIGDVIASYLSVYIIQSLYLSLAKDD